MISLQDRPLRRLLWAALAIALGGCAAGGKFDRPRPAQETEFHVPPGAVPRLGLCRIG